MSALSWWPHYDKRGQRAYSARIKATGQTLTISRRDLDVADGFVVELERDELRATKTLAEAKQFAQRTADNLTASHHARAIKAGLTPPELF